MSRFFEFAVVGVSLALLTVPQVRGQVVWSETFSFDAATTAPSTLIAPATFFNNTGLSESMLFTMGGGVLAQRTNGISGNASFVYYPGFVVADPNLDLVIETRLAVFEADGVYGGYVAVEDGQSRYALYATFDAASGQYGIELPGAAGPAFVPVLSQAMNVIRLESDAGQPNVRLFLNGSAVTLPVGFVPEPSGLNGYGFGDGFSPGGNGADLDWDYLWMAQGNGLFAGSGNVVSLPSPASATPSSPGVGAPTTLSVDVTNVSLCTTVVDTSFYEGNPDLGGTFIGSQQLTVGVGVTRTFQSTWFPSAAGNRAIFAVAHVPFLTEAQTSDNRSSFSVQVGAPPEELTVEAGARTAWPGALLRTPVTIRNTGSGPATIASTATPHPWATLVNQPDGMTLQPGETHTLLVDLDVPSGTSGGMIGEAPVSYAVPVSASTAQTTFSDEIDVAVYDQPLSQVTIRVEDADTSAPLAGALVTVESLPGQLTTNAAGEVFVDLPTGPRGFFAYKPGYAAAAVSETLVAGANLVVIPLTLGPTLQVNSITAVPLTPAEILARGINVNDPVNNHIVDFVIAVCINQPPVVLSNMEVPMSPAVPYTVSGIAWPAGRGGITLGGGSGPVHVTGVIQPVPGGMCENWLLIPGQVQALLQFFDATMYVVNNASAPNPTDVQLDDVTANFTLPAGLGLPDLDGVPQSLTQNLGTIDAGASAQANWVIRGDTPGTYTLSGVVDADLYAFGTFSTNLSFPATGEPFDVVLPDLRLEFVLPGSVTSGQSFNADIIVTNEQSVPAHFVTVRLTHDPDHPLADYLAELASVQPPGVTTTANGMGTIIEAEMALGTIDPGQSALASFNLVSPATGNVVSAGVQHWSSSSPAPTISIAPQYAGTDPTCTILSGVDEPLNAQSLKVGYTGQEATIIIDAPIHAGGLLSLVTGLFYNGMQPAEFFPGIWVAGGLGLVVLPAEPVLPQGNMFSFTVVPGYQDFSFLVQGVIISPATAGSYCATDAHEFRVLP